MPEITCKTQHIHPSARFGNDVKIFAETLHIGANAVIDDDVHIHGTEVNIESGAYIGKRVKVQTDRLSLGYKTSIGSDCRLSGIGGWAEIIDFGDNCLVGEFNIFLVPELVTGDYVAIHHHTLANGYSPCLIGHNTWIGQNCILNSTAELTIGNNVGIGAYSSIYTHAFNGELLEGCQMFKVAPVVIQDNAWIVGSYNVISPGVKVGPRSIILSSSVVSKDVPAMHTVGGVPAIDLTDRIMPYRNLSVEEKFEMMRRFIREFAEQAYRNCNTQIRDGYRIRPEERSPFTVLAREVAKDSDLKGDEIVLLYVKRNLAINNNQKVSIFDLSTKQYTKRRTEPEMEIIKFMNGYRARFVPINRPVIQRV